MRRFAYYFGLFVCGSMSICNAVMVYLSIGVHPAGWLGVVFFGAFTVWWGWQLYRFIYDFKHLNV